MSASLHSTVVRPSIVGALGKAVENATAYLTADLERSRSVLRDAIDRLLTSFRSMLETIVEQRRLLESATATFRQAEHPGGTSFGETASLLVREFVDETVRVSRESVRILEHLDQLGEKVSFIMKRASHIERLATEARFLALNARIETERAGKAGLTFGVVADEVKRLAGSSAGLSKEIRRELEECHASLNGSSQAARALASHDMNTALASHKGLGEAIAGLDRVNETLAGTLAQMEVATASAIQALQFEDIMNQLLEGLRNKVTDFGSAVAEALEVAAAPVEEGARRVSGLVSRIEALGAAGAVSQGDMRGGNVELF